jgi:hypothetical protein
MMPVTFSLVPQTFKTMKPLEETFFIFPKLQFPLCKFAAYYLFKETRWASTWEWPLKKQLSCGCPKNISPPVLPLIPSHIIGFLPLLDYSC